MKSQLLTMRMLEHKQTVPIPNSHGPSVALHCSYDKDCPIFNRKCNFPSQSGHGLTLPKGVLHVLSMLHVCQPSHFRMWQSICSHCSLCPHPHHPPKSQSSNANITHQNSFLMSQSARSPPLLSLTPCLSYGAPIITSIHIYLWFSD